MIVENCVVVRKILDILYPARCPLCDRVIIRREGLYLCKECSNLPINANPFCMKCGRMLTSEAQELCSDCMVHQKNFDQGRACFLHTGAVRDSVYRFKFKGRQEYAEYYAAAMTASFSAVIRAWEPQCVIPVPLHKKRMRERGYNQAELLGRRIAESMQLSFDKRYIIRRRATIASKELDRKQRRENLKGAFCIKKEFIPYKSVLLIDDIYTTGSTINEIAAILKNDGIKRIYFLVICTGRGS